MRLFKLALLGITTLTATATLAYVFFVFSGSTRASSESAGYIQFRESEVSSDSSGVVRFDIMLINTKAISRATIALRLPNNTYEYTVDENEFLSPECQSLNSFTALENTINETANGWLTITKSSGVNGDIPPGTHCFGTISLRPFNLEETNKTHKIRINMSKSKTFAQGSNGIIYDLNSSENKRTLLVTLFPSIRNIIDTPETPLIQDVIEPEPIVNCVPQNPADSNCDGILDKNDIQSPGTRMMEDGIY